MSVGWHHQALSGRAAAVSRAHRESGPVLVGRANDGVREVPDGAPGPPVVGAGDLAQPCHVDPGVELVVLGHLPRDGNEEEENVPCLLVVQGAWVHGAVALHLGLGHRLLCTPLQVRREGEAQLGNGQ